MGTDKLVVIGVILIGLIIFSPALSEILDSIYDATYSDEYSPQEQAFRKSLKFGVDLLLFINDYALLLIALIAVIIFLSTR
jgi:hypothetical protein